VGTRPEAIKMAPVVRAIGRRAIEQRMILTGQHPGLRWISMLRKSSTSPPIRPI